jgi:L-serine dehydratase
MESIKTIYKIGHGPSSSHTIGPTIAARLFKKRFPSADAFKVTLYGSLALTGKGHMTDAAIKESFAPTKAEVAFNPKETHIEHPNTMDLIAFKDNKEIGRNRVYSIGGGSISIQGEGDPFASDQVYPHNHFSEIKEYCLANKLTLLQYIEKFEPKDT